jgi:hypothetical protein
MRRWIPACAGMTRNINLRKPQSTLLEKGLADFLKGVTGLVELMNQFDPLNGLIVEEAMAAGGSLDFSNKAEHEVVLDGMPREVRKACDIGDA